MFGAAPLPSTQLCSWMAKEHPLPASADSPNSAPPQQKRLGYGYPTPWAPGAASEGKTEASRAQLLTGILLSHAAGLLSACPIQSADHSYHHLWNGGTRASVHRLKYEPVRSWNRKCSGPKASQGVRATFILAFGKPFPREDHLALCPLVTGRAFNLSSLTR